MELIKIIDGVKKELEAKEQKEKRIKDLINKISKEIQDTYVNQMMDAFETGDNLKVENTGDWITFDFILDFDIESTGEFQELASLVPGEVESILKRLRKLSANHLAEMKETLNSKLSELGAPKCTDVVTLETFCDHFKKGFQLIQVLFEI